MAVTPTYPGVYIEEIPSGVRTITGVATSIAAFVGRAKRGPVNEATTIYSFSEYERVFGGLWTDSTMSYAVRDFYLNGGGQAIVVRLASGATRATISLAGGLKLEAASEGSWGDTLQASVDHDVRDDVAARFGLTAADLFNLSVTDTATGATEQFLNLSVKPGARQAHRVLVAGSSLVRVSGALPSGVPDATTAPVGVADGDKASDGAALVANDYVGPGLQAAKQGLWALEHADLFNLLCITPPDRGDSDTDASVYVEALAYCVSRRAVLLVDPPHDMSAAAASAALDALGLSGDGARNAAIYFPRVREADLLSGGQTDTFVPCGIVAGVMARTDAERGVWKAPAGLDASLRGTQALAETVTDGESGALNQLGINALRSFPVVGRVVWGARTLRGADILADEYKYLPVRRLALFIEESLFRGTQWVVFEPNDEPLWAQIRLNVGAFMQGLFRQGAFQGTTPREAYFVKCDKETTTQNDIDLGRVNILVGFAPLKPAEFVIIQIQQMAGQVQA
jgi:phage tail sheath protein FI